MKKIFVLLCVLFTGIAVAEPINITWYNEDGTTYDTTTCNAGDTLILPTAPTKRGYTFLGWVSYSPIEYLESTGTQAIDTGFVFSSAHDYRLVTRFSFSNLDSTTCLSGAENNGNGWAFVPQRQGAGLRFFHISLSAVAGRTLTAGDIYTLEMSQTGVVFTIKMTGFDDYSSIVNNVSYPITSYALFSDKYINGNFTQKISARMYYFQIYEDNALVRDFIPVLDSDRVPCMYDKVSQSCFYNAGTGDFIAGPVIGE